MAKSVAELRDEAEIKELQIRFCRANDRRDETLLRGCFHPDATIELHEPLDVEAFVDVSRSILDKYMLTWHNTGNQYVVLFGYRALAEHYTISSHRIAADSEGPERDFVVHGRHIDIVERRDGIWAILERRFVGDYARTDPVADTEIALGVEFGARDKGDLSYVMGARLDAIIAQDG